MTYTPREKLTEEEVRAIAEKDGPSSNAAFALFEASVHDGPVIYFRTGDVFIIDCLPKPKQK